MSLVEEELGWTVSDWVKEAATAADYAAKNCIEFFGVMPWRRPDIFLVFGISVPAGPNAISADTMVKFRQLLHDAGIRELGFNTCEVFAEVTWAVLIDTAQFKVRPDSLDPEGTRDVEGTLRLLLRGAMCFAAGGQPILRSTKVLPGSCQERDRMRHASSDVKKKKKKGITR
jgi:hypothetical protein